MEGQTKSEFLIRLWVLSSKGWGILGDVASAKAEIPLQTAWTQLARPDKSWDVEQQGGLADNELCPRILQSLGQQQFKYPGKGLAVSAVAGMITQGGFTRTCTYLFFWVLCCYSLAMHWGEKNLIFVVKKHWESVFFQRGKMCLNWKKNVLLCVCSVCILKGRTKNKQIFFFVCPKFLELCQFSAPCVLPSSKEILFIPIIRAFHRWKWDLVPPEPGNGNASWIRGFH